MTTPDAVELVSHVGHEIPGLSLSRKNSAKRHDPRPEAATAASRITNDGICTFGRRRRWFKARIGRSSAGELVLREGPRRAQSALLRLLGQVRVRQAGVVSPRPRSPGLRIPGGRVGFHVRGRSTAAPLLHLRRLSAAGQGVGATALTFHGLRHEHASLLLSAGVSITAVSKRLGRSSASITSDLYSHLLEDADRQMADAVQGVLDAGNRFEHTLSTQRPAATEKGRTSEE